MFLEKLIVNGSWVTLAFYWIIFSFFTKPTQEKVSGIGEYWHYLFMLISFSLLFYTSENPFKKSFNSPPLTGFGEIFMVVGLLICLIARKTLSSNWSGSVTLKKNHKLITNGIYTYIRHPIYTGILLMYLGNLFIFADVYAVLGFVILFTTFWFKLKQEEILMTKYFPKEYQSYKTKAKRLIPFIL